jgi:hypothetical protein
MLAKYKYFPRFEARLAAVRVIIFIGDLKTAICPHITHQLRRTMSCVVDCATELQLLKLENVRDGRMFLDLSKFLDTRTWRRRYPAEIWKSLALAVADGSLQRAWLQYYACGAVQDAVGIRHGTFRVTLSETITGIFGYDPFSNAWSEYRHVSFLFHKTVTKLDFAAR